MNTSVREPRQLVDEQAKITNRAFRGMSPDMSHKVNHHKGKRVLPQLLDRSIVFSPGSDECALQALFYLRYTAQEMCGSVEVTPAFDCAESRRD